MQYHHNAPSGLSAEGKAISSAIITRTHHANLHDVKIALITATHNAGCQFLFEIPADLFGYENFKGAAIKLNVASLENDLAFILMNEETGILHIISQKEAPCRAIRFVRSYARVLGLLQQNTGKTH